MIKTKLNVAVVLLASVAVCFGQQGSLRIDGNWWQRLDPLEKSVYVVGFLDACELASIAVFGNELAGERLGAVFPSGNVNVGQLADGLDSFYADYRNRSIKVRQAIGIVGKSIAGAKPEEIQKLTEAMRQAANQGN